MNIFFTYSKGTTMYHTIRKTYPKTDHGDKNSIPQFNKGYHT